MTQSNEASAGAILLIEDEPAVSAFLRAALETRGYAVVPAASGQEGLDLLIHGRYGGVISDIHTPGTVNATEVHEWIRANRPELEQRFILMSGDTANKKTQALVQGSGIPFIEKPFRLQNLISVVESTFGRP